MRWVMSRRPDTQSHRASDGTSTTVAGAGGRPSWSVTRPLPTRRWIHNSPSRWKATTDRQGSPAGPARGSAEAGEVGLSLVEERMPSFFGFGRLVEEVDGRDGEAAEGGDHLGVDGEGLLGQFQRRRAEAEDLVAPPHRFGHEVGARDDGVDEAHGQRLGGAVTPAEEPDLASLALADEAGQVGGAEAGVHASDLGADL